MFLFSNSIQFCCSSCLQELRNIIQDSTKDFLFFKYWILQHLEQSSGIIFIRNFREIKGKCLDDLLAVTMKKILLVTSLVQDPIIEDDKKSESTNL